MSLAALLFDEGQDTDLLVHAGGADHTRGQVRERAEVLAGALHDAGVGDGAPVGVMLPNGVEVVAALFGVWRAGAVYVPLNPRLAATDLDHVLASVRPAAILTTQEHEARFGDRVVVVADDVGGVTLRSGRSGDRRFDPGVALVQFTSGTTGRPKPVLLEHDGVLQLLDPVVRTLRSGTTTDRTKPAMPNLIPVSLSLWSGIYQVLFAMRVGAPVVIMDEFDTRELAALVERFAIRSTVLPPAAMVMLCDDERVTSLDPLRYVRSIGSPLSPFQARRFRDKFGIAIMNCYGQTEIGGEIVGWSGAEAKEFGESKLGAVGRPHAGVQVRVDDGSGELQVRTPALSAGYADGGDLSDRLTPDGWFRTGDIARIDDDGFVWIEGRVSDMINRGGLKVFPGEVEEVLRLSPRVADVAVAGVADDRLGEVPWAFVVPDGEGPSDDELADELRALCREHLAPYKAPVHFVVVGSLPRNEAGKILAHELTARAAD
jgi:acyl-CoA synthetase (AMP-forming)/AMP-acid ligase II